MPAETPYTERLAQFVVYAICACFFLCALGLIVAPFYVLYCEASERGLWYVMKMSVSLFVPHVLALVFIVCCLVRFKFA